MSVSIKFQFVAQISRENSPKQTHCKISLKIVKKLQAFVFTSTGQGYNITIFTNPQIPKTRTNNAQSLKTTLKTNYLHVIIARKVKATKPLCVETVSRIVIFSLEKSEQKTTK